MMAVAEEKMAKGAKSSKKNIFTIISEIANFIKNIGVIFALIFGFVYFLLPGGARDFVNRLSPDRSYFFVGTINLDNRVMSKPRFQTGIFAGEIPLNDKAEIVRGTLLFPKKDYVYGNAADPIKIIVARSKPTTVGSSARFLLDQKQCLQVYQTVLKKLDCKKYHHESCPRERRVWVDATPFSCTSGSQWNN